MTVYFVENIITKNIKIGYTSKSPRQRVRQLNTAHDVNLKLLAYIDAEKDMEKRLQYICRDLWVCREWY